MKDVHVKLNQDFHNKSGTQQEGDFCTGKMNLNLGKTSEKCYISSTTLYGDEICTLRIIDKKYLKIF